MSLQGNSLQTSEIKEQEDQSNFLLSYYLNQPSDLRDLKDALHNKHLFDLAHFGLPHGPVVKLCLLQYGRAGLLSPRRLLVSWEGQDVVPVRVVRSVIHHLNRPPPGDKREHADLFIKLANRMRWE